MPTPSNVGLSHQPTTKCDSLRGQPITHWIPPSPRSDRASLVLSPGISGIEGVGLDEKQCKHEPIANGQAEARHRRQGSAVVPTDTVKPVSETWARHVVHDVTRPPGVLGTPPNDTHRSSAVRHDSWDVCQRQVIHPRQSRERSSAPLFSMPCSVQDQD